MFNRQFSAAAHRASSRYAAEQLEPVVDGMVVLQWSQAQMPLSQFITSLHPTSYIVIVCVVLFYIRQFYSSSLLLVSNVSQQIVTSCDFCALVLLVVFQIRREASAVICAWYFLISSNEHLQNLLPITWRMKTHLYSMNTNIVLQIYNGQD